MKTVTTIEIAKESNDVIITFVGNNSKYPDLDGRQYRGIILKAGKKQITFSGYRTHGNYIAIAPIKTEIFNSKISEIKRIEISE